MKKVASAAIAGARLHFTKSLRRFDDTVVLAHNCPPKCSLFFASAKKAPLLPSAKEGRILMVPL